MTEACDPDTHWWDQDGPNSVSCYQCGADGIITEVKDDQRDEVGTPVGEPGKCRDGCGDCGCPDW